MATDGRLVARCSPKRPPQPSIRPVRSSEDYAHLHVNRSIASLAYLPLLDQESLLGAIEVVAFSKALGSADLASLRLRGWLRQRIRREFDRGRQDLLDSVHRMTQLYDLEKSLNATLELDEVTALASEKTAAMLECQAIHLWLFDGAQLRLMSSSGADATVHLRTPGALGRAASCRYGRGVASRY